MRRFILLSAILFACGSLRAAELALVYENEEALLAGRSLIGTITPDGVLIPATTALKSAGTLYLAVPGQPLSKGSLLRLDTEADLALIKAGELVSDPKLQEAHKKKSAVVLKFLPDQATLESGGIPRTASAYGFALSTETFAVRLNGVPVGHEEFVLPVKSKKSKVTLDIVNVSTSSTWTVAVKLSSDPPLSFWKKGQKMGLNDVPQRVFNYSEQLFFRPLSTNRTLSVPIEIYYIKSDRYLWTIEVKSKMGSVVKQANIRFKS